MNTNKALLFLPIIVVLCLNLGSPDVSVAGGEKPAINFKGKLQDTNGDTYVVENITISGMYKQIPMYKKPNKVTLKPTDNVTRIDLSEINLILVPDKKTLTFDGRDYVELEITYKDPTKTKENFIIEKYKRVWCDQVNAAGPIEKDLAFSAVETLSIESYKMSELVQNGQDANEKEASQNKSEGGKIENPK